MMEEIVIHKVPLYLVALNRLAKLGGAQTYTQSRKFVRFDISPQLATKWRDLKDVTSIIIVYEPKEVL